MSHFRGYSIYDYILHFVLILRCPHFVLHACSTLYPYLSLQACSSIECMIAGWAGFALSNHIFLNGMLMYKNEEQFTNYTLFVTPGATAYSNSYFGHGSGCVHMNNVGCTGTESRLVECSYNRYFCYPWQHAGVQCQTGMLTSTHYTVTTKIF